jgi:carbon monoxide dehydrogenase subunit G
MDISGECWLPAPRDEVWRLLHDVDALRRCVPGCVWVGIKDDSGPLSPFVLNGLQAVAFAE